MRDLSNTPFLAKDKGKQPFDVTRVQAKKMQERNSVERVELASISTREKPLLLGGTAKDAQKYIDELSKEERDAFSAFCKRLSQLSRDEVPNPTEVAKGENKMGYEIKREYTRRYHLKADSEAGSSRPTTGEVRLKPKDKETSYPGTDEERQQRYWSQYDR